MNTWNDLISLSSKTFKCGHPAFGKNVYENDNRKRCKQCMINTVKAWRERKRNATRDKK